MKQNPKYPNYNVTKYSKQQTQPIWKTRIEENRHYPGRKLKRDVLILKKLGLKKDDFNTKLTEAKEEIKQTIAMLGKRLWRYNRSLKRRRQNKILTNNGRNF